MTVRLSGRAVKAAVFVVAVALDLLLGASAWAGRPLTTEDTGTLDPGQVELELSADYVRDGRSDLFLLPRGPALNFGLLPRLEGGVGTSVILVAPDDGASQAGFGDTEMRLKYRFLDESPRVPAIMGAVVARLPTGDEDRGLGAPGVDVQALAVVSKTFGAVTATLNAGYTFVTDDRSLDVVNVNASAEWRLTSVWSMVGEVVAELATSRQNDDRLVLRAGTVYALGERVRLDAAAAVGVARASPDLLLTIGPTVLLTR